MRLSEDKVSHIAHLLTEGPALKGWIETPDQGRLLKVTKQVLGHFCHLDEEVDVVVRKKLASYGRGIPEGSREWDVLYRKHFQEEMKKRWR
ncbi:MAG: DUF507 family protein [Pseudomonadota bacterium]